MLLKGVINIWPPVKLTNSRARRACTPLSCCGHYCQTVRAVAEIGDPEAQARLFLF
jgi:hypothetical protein